MSLPPATPADARSPRGVGGWLLILIGTLALVFPVADIYANLYEFANSAAIHGTLSQAPGWSLYQRAIWYLTAAGVVVNVLAGFLLWKQHFPSAVRFAIAALWLTGPVRWVLMELAYEWALNPSTDQLLDYSTLARAASSMALPLLWTVYLLKSRRVKATYFSG